MMSGETIQIEHYNCQYSCIRISNGNFINEKENGQTKWRKEKGRQYIILLIGTGTCWISIGNRIGMVHDEKHSYD